jgi:hypothetical protein
MRNPAFCLSWAVFGFLGASLMVPGPAAAHHSFALFDSSKSVTLEGKVKEFEWTNPHSWIHLVVIGENNQAEEWLIELPAAATLARDGWGKNYVKPGERLLVRVNPLKNGMKVGSLQAFRTEAE